LGKGGGGEVYSAAKLIKNSNDEEIEGFNKVIKIMSYSAHFSTESLTELTNALLASHENIVEIEDIFY